MKRQQFQNKIFQNVTCGIFKKPLRENKINEERRLFEMRVWGYFVIFVCHLTGESSR